MFLFFCKLNHDLFPKYIWCSMHIHLDQFTSFFSDPYRFHQILSEPFSKLFMIRKVPEVPLRPHQMISLCRRMNFFQPQIISNNFQRQHSLIQLSSGQTDMKLQLLMYPFTSFHILLDSFRSFQSIFFSDFFLKEISFDIRFSLIFEISL